MYIYVYFEIYIYNKHRKNSINMNVYIKFYVVLVEIEKQDNCKQLIRCNKIMQQKSA